MSSVSSNSARGGLGAQAIQFDDEPGPVVRESLASRWRRAGRAVLPDQPAHPLNPETQLIVRKRLDVQHWWRYAAGEHIHRVTIDVHTVDCHAGLCSIDDATVKLR